MIELNKVEIDDVVLAIKRLQHKDRLRDVEIAVAIGVNPTTWRRIKTGATSYGRRFLDGAKKAYPGIFLAEDVTKR